MTVETNISNGESQDRRFGTLAVHAGAPHDPITGAVIAPVSLQSTLLVDFISMIFLAPLPC